MGFFVLILIFLFGKSFIDMIRDVPKKGFRSIFKHPLALIISFIIACSTGFFKAAFIGFVMYQVFKNVKCASDSKPASSGQKQFRKPDTGFDAYADTAPSGDFKNNQYYNQYYSASYQNTPQTGIINSYGLPEAPRKRKKIVDRFNKQYQLNLTQKEINRIVDASYLSTSWAREICYMNQHYESIYSWYATMNSWLKVYLYVFQVQNISSDFAMQERIVFDSFDRIFSEFCNDKDTPLDVIIAKINQKYFTNFDESTFMIAYRYMESKGKRYSFACNPMCSSTEDIDNLLKKYETTQKPQ